METRHSEIRRRLARSFGAAAVAVAMTFGVGAAHAAAKPPVRIGIIAWQANPLGAGIKDGAILAANEINAAGGIDGRKIELFQYDDHASATDGVRAFQRAVKQDHVVAVIGGFISEVDFGIIPWASRFHVPFIAGGASNKIATMVHNDYGKYKYIFEQTPNSYYLARAVCDISHYALVKKLGFKTAVVLSEDAAWTKSLDQGYLACLPKAGLKVVDHIRFAPNTKDFTPLFNKVEATHANVIIAGMAHVGLAPTVQWHDQQVPALLAGFNAQAGASNFWKRSNGATEGVITWNAGAPGAAVTPKSIPFTDAYVKMFKTTPTLEAYMTYDSMYALKAAVERARSTNANALVAALEKTDIVGSMGRIKYYGRKARFTHDVQYGEHLVSGVGIQWQNGKQVAIWPAHAANGQPMLPGFVKAASK